MKKPIWMMAALVALGALVVGCGESGESEPQDETESAEVEVETEDAAAEADSELVERAQDLAALASAIESEPERVDELLDEAGLSAEELEELLFDIAADPAASQAYADAR
jgi:hypothetical protein